MKKRILSMLMAICLVTTLVSVCAVSASAEEGTNFMFMNPTKAKAGETIEVPIYASITGDGIACIAFTPEYDHTALELMEIQCGLNGGSFLYNFDPANPKCIWYNTQNSGGISTEQPMFTLVFTAKENAREGTYPITLYINENDVCDEKGNYVPLQVEAGEVTIFRYLLADVNNDMLIDSADVVKLARYLVYMETEINTYGADVNKDGEIDGRDLIKLSRYMVGLEAIDGVVYY